MVKETQMCVYQQNKRGEQEKDRRGEERRGEKRKEKKRKEKKRRHKEADPAQNPALFVWYVHIDRQTDRQKHEMQPNSAS